MYCLPSIELRQTSFDTSFENDKRVSSFGGGEE